MTKVDLSKYESQKRYLKRYRKNRLLIERLEDKLAKLDERLFKIKSVSFGETVRGGIPVTMDDLLADKDDLSRRINKLLIKGRKYRTEIVDAIDELDDAQSAEILEMFFVDCKDFDIIADELGYSVRHVTRIYNEAINELAYKCLNDESSLA